MKHLIAGRAWSGLAIIIVLLVPFAGAQEFSTPINISNSAGGSIIPKMVVDHQGNIYIAWMDNVDPQATRDIFFSRSIDGGQTFSLPINISDDPGDSSIEQIALDSVGNIFILWHEANAPGPLSVYIARSLDRGETFSKLNLAYESAVPFAQMAIDICNNINVVWDRGDSSGYWFAFRRSTDGGATFSDPINLSEKGYHNHRPRIAVDNQGKIFVAFNDYVGGIWGAFLRSSTDGIKFSEPILIGNGYAVEVAGGRKLVIDALGNLDLILIGPPIVDSQYSEVYFCRSNDGTNFTLPLNISNDATVSMAADMVVDTQGNISVVWMDSTGNARPTRINVKFSRSIDGGNCFSLPQDLTLETGGDSYVTSTKPRLAVDRKGYINVVWEDVRPTGGYTQAWFTRSTDGTNFSSPLNLSSTLTGHSGEPWIELSPEGNVYVVWHGNTPENYQNSDIYFCRGIFNQPPVAEAGGPYTDTEGTPVLLSGEGSTDPEDNIVSYEWDLDGDGEYDDAVGATPMFTWPDNVTLEIGLKVTDDAGQSSADTASVTIGNAAPVIVTITTPVDPVPINTQINASATFTDAGVFDTHTAIWDWGDQTTSEGTVTEAEGSGSVEGTHNYLIPGIYTVKLTVTDKDGGVAQATSTLLVVYDPAGGFVTGAGWFDSPAGAYSPDPTLTGKAHFGLVSRYEKGATVPTGQTKFHFQVANLNFHSETYEWMVVAGARVQYKGVGTINNQGNYGFMIVAIDGQMPGGGGLDKFRIKIWDKATETIIYDNEMGVPETGNPFTVIQGGSIIIHR